MDELYEKYLNERLKSIFKNVDGKEPSFNTNDLGYYRDRNGKSWYRDDSAKIIEERIDYHDKYGLKDKFGIEILPPIYDEIKWIDDILRVMIQKGHIKEYNYVTASGKEITKNSYEYLDKFSEGFAPAMRDGKTLYIDENGKEYCRGKFDELFPFTNGFAIVKKGDKYNYIDKNMSLVCSEWYDQVIPFSEGFAMVANEVPKEKERSTVYGWWVIDSTGKKIGEMHRGYKWDRREGITFNEGYATIHGTDGYYYYIGKDGKIAFNQGFGYAREFFDGKARVGRKWTGYSYDDEILLADGRVVKDRDLVNFDSLNFPQKIYLDGEPFTDSLVDHRKPRRFIRVEKEYDEYVYRKGTSIALGTTNFYDTVEKKLALNEWFVKSYGWSESSRIVLIEGNNGKYNFFDRDTGNLAFNEWLDRASTNDYIVQRGKKYNLFNQVTGQLVDKEWFDYIESINFTHNYMVKRDGLWNLMDSKGNFVFEQWSMTPIKEENIREPYSPNFIIMHKSLLPDFRYHESLPHTSQLFCTTKDLNGYDVKRTLSEYICSKGDDTFEIDYEPVVIYDDNNVLCVRKDNKDTYKREAELCLFNRKDKSYRRLGSISDVRFLKNMIFDSKNQKVTMVYDGKVLDITDYYKKNLIGKETMSIKENLKILSKEEFAEKMKASNAKREVMDSIDKIYESLENLREIEKRKGNPPKLENIQSIIVYRNGHKVINPVYIENGLLPYIDFSGISLEGVEIPEGLDLSNTNIELPKEETEEHHNRK